MILLLISTININKMKEFKTVNDLRFIIKDNKNLDQIQNIQN